MRNHRLLTVVVFCIILWGVGVVGYELIEGWNFQDSLFMTAISLTTVGYGEVHPLSPAGRIFTIALITLGVGFFFYALGILAEATIEGHIKGIWGQRRMEKTIKKLSSHFVICGFGRIGRTICEEICKRGIPLVVVENDPDAIDGIKTCNYAFVEGDATHEDVLKKAGVERARGVICVLPSDADNVYATLTTRSLNPGLLIVSRADDVHAETKMMQAGADRVIRPYDIGAKRMALAVLRPTIIEFLDLAVHSSVLDLGIEQIEIHGGSKLDGSTLQDAGIRNKTGATILAVQQFGEHMVVSPGADYRLNGGDIVVALGSNQSLTLLKELAGDI